MDWILEYCEGESGFHGTDIPEYANGNNPVMGENAVIIIGICRRNSINPAQDTESPPDSRELLLRGDWHLLGQLSYPVS